MIDKYIKISEIKSIIEKIEISGHVNKNDFLKEVAKLTGHRKPKKEQKFYVKGVLDKIRLIKNYQQKNMKSDEVGVFQQFVTSARFHSIKYRVSRGLSIYNPIDNAFHVYEHNNEEEIYNSVLSILYDNENYNENNIVTQAELMKILKITKPTFYKWIDEQIIVKHDIREAEYFDLEEIKNNLYSYK